ncbi:MAG: SPOR domain-containing protein, partial [Gammaproteobacteria bacterium]
KRAADSGYPQATAALVELQAGRLVRTDKSDEVVNISYDDPMIVSTQLSSAPTSATQGEPSDKLADSSSADAMPQPVASTPSVAQTATGLPAAEGVPASGRGWVAQQPAANYTIQLLASTQMSGCEEQVERLQERYQLETHAHAFALNGRKLCSVIYGSYEKRAQAKAKLKQLPRHIRQGKPWIRKLGQLQELAI